MSTTIHVGNALDVLAGLPSESVHCCVTSPPYWGLRSYGGGAGMIGLEPTFEEHLANLVAVFREVRRVLRDDGTLWLNYGDAYASIGRSPKKESPGVGATQAMPRVERDVVWKAGGGSKFSWTLPGGYKPKDLMMMPARGAMALQADGAADIHAMKTIMDVRNRIFDAYEDETPPDRILAVLEAMQVEYAQAKGESWWLRSEIIWHKPNPMPESCTDRPTSSHEKLFLLTKSPRYFYDAEAVRATSAKPWKKDMLYEGKSAEMHRQGGKGRNAAYDRSKSTGDDASANLRNVWTIPTHSYKGAHFATFPPALVEPCIKAGTRRARRLRGVRSAVDAAGGTTT